MRITLCRKTLEWYRTIIRSENVAHQVLKQFVCGTAVLYMLWHGAQRWYNRKIVNILKYEA
jgi:hypothetical protein